MTPHPEPERLLRYADGELAGAWRQSVVEHLDTCAECRAWLEELKSGEAEYAQTWMPALHGTTAPPPAPWVDLRARMAEIDAIPARKALPRWLAAAAAVIAVFIAARWFMAGRVGAAELLRAASAREESWRSARLPIRVRTRTGSLVRPAVWITNKRTHPEPLRILFESANYSWEDPLSVRSFSKWRASLRSRRDSVVKFRSPDGNTVYEVATRTDANTLTEARLRLRAADYHAFHGTFRFRNDESVEISEESGEVPAPDTQRPPVAAAQPPQPAEPAAPEPVTPGEELQVWLALHRIGADLGEPVQVERDVNELVITALGAGPARRRLIQEALSGLPRVTVRFSDPQPLRTPSRDLSAPQAAAQAPLLPNIEAQLGSRIEAEEFANRVLERSESALLRAHAIRKLAERFPPAAESQLSAAERAALARMLAEHFSALSAASKAALEDMRQIAPPASASPVAPAADWRTAGANLLAAAEQADKLLTRMLAVSGEAPQMREMGAALSALEAQIEAAKPVFGGMR